MAFGTDGEGVGFTMVCFAKASAPGLILLRRALAGTRANPVFEVEAVAADSDSLLSCF